MLMIGGECDPSLGSRFAGILEALPAVEWGVPLWLWILFAFAVAIGVVWLNRAIVRWTSLPSFIVTLADLFILRGLTLGITRALSGRPQLPGLRDAPQGDGWCRCSPASGARD